MSSTTNVQSYLPYVFRPVYTWNSNTGAFSTQFNMSNVDTLTVSTARFGVIYAGDISNNVYIGSNTGNLPAFAGTCNTVSNTAVGIGAAAATSNSSNSEFIGFQAGGVTKSICNSVVIGVSAGLSNSNVVNSILIGTANSTGTLFGTTNYVGLSNISNTICIGGNAGGTGNSNIFIGSSNGVGMIGSSNVLIGNGVNLSNIPGYTLVDGVTPNPSFSNASNLFMVGSSNNILIAGNFSTGVVSIGSTNTNANVCNAGVGNSLVSNTVPNLTLDVSKWMRVQNGLSIGCDPNQGYTLDVVGSFRAQDGYGQIYMSNAFDIGDGNGPLPTNAVVNINPTRPGGTMTVIVGGGVRAASAAVTGQVSASNVVVSNQVSAATGYSSVQSGTAGVSLAGSTPGPAGFITIPLKNNGLVTVFAYSSATSPAYVYSASYLVTNYVSNVAWPASNIMTIVATPNFSVVVSNANITISNSFLGNVTMFYNVTFFPIG